MKIYLASPLGFSPEYSGYRERIKEKLRQQGCHVLDPWDANQFQTNIAKAAEVTSASRREEAFGKVARMIGHANDLMIREAEMVLAVLDGLEVDSGTASEVGFASALGKRVYGLRTDWRNSGDFAGLPFNLQVIHFITSTGGRIFRSIDEITIERCP